MISRIVHAFYVDVRRDPALGPIFERALQGQWEEHLAKLCDFWSSVLLMSGRFKGTPMTTHLALPGLRPTHFARWLHLFARTVTEICPPAAATLFVAKSEMIGASLQLGMANAHRRSAAAASAF
ncbi:MULTISPECIES: group III truncated hemoglobin [Sphingosinicellaceae]|uniref:group III truncated hemoglobin n=1 Tax=Sphingosinicellaceae TaxID=2820280 RepID=UPI001D0234DE|nr:MULTISPECIES: group III truncated hemoglobin [Polymorphobacter]